MTTEINTINHQEFGLGTLTLGTFFFSSDHDESRLKHFISFCNSYSTNQNMRSKISFEADHSTSHVYFLNTKVKFNAHTLAIELYSKPSASFQFLHRTSSHPLHMFCSILKSKFIRISGICTDINDNWNHSQQFITFFKSHGFHDTILNKICQDTADTLRCDLFRNINGTLLKALLTPNKSNRIPLVTTWHHKLSGFQSILHRRYQEMINEYPHLRRIFSKPLILFFRRNKNLWNWVMHSYFTKPTPNTHFTPGHIAHRN